MKKLLFVLAAITLTLTGCRKETPEYLTVTPSNPILFSANAQEAFTLDVETNSCSTWEVTSNQAWCVVKKENNKIIVTALPNISVYSPAPATITVSCSTVPPVTIAANQLGVGADNKQDNEYKAALLTVSPMDDLHFSADAIEAYTLTVLTNQGAWDAVSDQPWVKILQGGTKVYISAQQNLMTTPSATATVTFTAGTATPVTITVTQDASEFVYMPDKEFNDYIVSSFDLDGDLRISKDEALQIDYISFYADKSRDLTGIESFANLTTMDLNGGLFTSLDFSKNAKLSEIYLANLEKGKTINTQGLTELRAIVVRSSALVSNLDLTTNTNLDYIRVNNTSVTNLDVSQNSKLEVLDASYNKLTSIDLSHNPLIRDVYVQNNQLVAINLNGTSTLKMLEVSSNSTLTSVDVTSSVRLESLYLNSTGISSLDVTKNPSLMYMNASYLSKITELDVSNNPKLMNLMCKIVPNMTTLWVSAGASTQGFSLDPQITIQEK